MNCSKSRCGALHKIWTVKTLTHYMKKVFSSHDAAHWFVYRGIHQWKWRETSDQGIHSTKLRVSTVYFYKIFRFFYENLFVLKYNLNYYLHKPTTNLYTTKVYSIRQVVWKQVLYIELLIIIFKIFVCNIFFLIWQLVGLEFLA